MLCDFRHENDFECRTEENTRIYTHAHTLDKCCKAENH